MVNKLLLAQGSDELLKSWKTWKNKLFWKNSGKFRGTQGKYGFLQRNQGKLKKVFMENFCFKTLRVSLLMFDIGNLENFYEMLSKTI